MEPQRFQEIFLQSLKGPLSDLFDLQTEAMTSFYLDQMPLQDSFRYRAKHLGLKVANWLLDEKGELNRERLGELNRLLEPCILGPRREGDLFIYDHLKRCLRSLAEKSEIWIAIKRFSPPLCHKKAEELIRDTLWPEAIRTVQTVHIRKAVLAAWLTLLRQSTGSCFATAPAILIQQNYPLRFFHDLYDLLSMGQMKRTVGGKEYSVPLSLNLGSGDLQRQVPFLEHSFGLKKALESVGVLRLAKIEGPQTVEKAIRFTLLENLGLTEEDLSDEEHLSRIQMTPLLARQTAVYYQRPSERAQKVATWKKNFAKACTAFQAITECALLRSWEYTLACLCDVKIEFGRWNLFIGLGMHPDQKDGVGEFLYRQVDAHLQAANREIEQLAREYDQESAAMAALETMIQGSVSETRINQLKSEWMTHNLSLSSLLESRTRLIEKAEGLVGFFSSLMQEYDQKLQEQFQELFDPALIGDEAYLYDDSPAGFRLVYKHGRRDASQWTSIYDGEGYVDALRDFFSTIENDLTVPPAIGRELLSEITTSLIQFIQQPEFLSAALRRSKESGKRSPWDYISGGTLQTLLQAYCNRDRAFIEAKIIPQSESKLLHFLITQKKSAPLLMHSPTHAFIFYPHLLDANSEHYALQNQQEVQKWKWDEEMQEHLAHRVSERLPDADRALFLHLYRQKPNSQDRTLFRNILIEALGPNVRNQAALVDSVLYEQTPLLTQPQAKSAIEHILAALGIHQRIPSLSGSFFGPIDLTQIVKATLLTQLGNALSSEDWDLKITETMRRLRYLQPHSILFADTNWSNWLFGFVINPATAQLELWRLNRTATQGFPMSDWKEGLNSPWVVLSKPEEYTF